MNYARKIKIALTAGLMLASAQSQAQDVSVFVDQLATQVSEQLHDLWRADLNDDEMARLKKEARWKTSGETNPSVKSLRPETLKEFIEIREQVMTFDETYRAHEAFALRSVEFLTEEQATDLKDGKRVLKTFKTSDGATFKAGKIEQPGRPTRYFRVGAKVDINLINDPSVLRGGKVIPTINIGALKGSELTAAWKGANMAAAEIATHEVMQLILSDEPVTMSALEKVRLRINKRYVDAGTAWTEIAKNPQDHLPVEKIVHKLNLGAEISGSERALVAKYLGDSAQGLPEAFTAESLVQVKGGSSLLRGIYELGLQAHKDRVHIDTVINTVMKNVKVVEASGLNGLHFMRLGNLTRSVMNATPNFSRLVEVIKKAR